MCNVNETFLNAKKIQSNPVRTERITDSLNVSSRTINECVVVVAASALTVTLHET